MNPLRKFDRNLQKTGALLAAAGVALGAFGAHGLKTRISTEMLEVYQTATHYLMIHAIALILFARSGIRHPWPGRCFLLGIFIFSGSLYAMVATGIKMLGAITPIGGLLFIAGWLGFAWLSPKEP